MSEILPPPTGSARARVLLVLALAGVWLLPWAEIRDPARGTILTQDGAARTGIPALAALIVLWGLALTALAARSRRALRAGEAFTAAALAGCACALLLAEHPWLGVGERAATLLPVFGPLALLAALDGALRLSSPQAGGEIGAVRVGAGVFAAGSLLADEAPAAAALALAISAGPLAFLLGRSASAARRSLDGLITLSALAAGFAPTLQRWLTSVPDPIAGLMPSAIAWSVLAALVVLTGASGLFAPFEEAGAAGTVAPAEPR